ncbi:conserved hypothetical protein [Vibrio phage 501E54-1]|nr:conserved hypothetical protein [Vibrio phage 501E54-1]
MSVTMIISNTKYNEQCDQWIDMACEKKNITLRDLYQVTTQYSQQLQMQEQIPPQMGGKELNYNESLTVAWASTILERIKQRIEQGE